MKELAKRVREAYHSDENLKKKNNRSNIKLFVGLGKSLLADVIGFSIKSYYNDPASCIEAQSRWKLFMHDEIEDDTPLDLLFGTDYVTALEASLFGQKVIFPENGDPTYDKPIILEHNDLDDIQEIDFFRSGIMPKVHRMYNGVGELLDDDFQIFFPGFARGPWSMATILRGFNDLFIDTVDDPEFVHRIMEKIVSCRIDFEEQRCRYLGIDPADRTYIWKYATYRLNTSGDQFEDEVDGSLFSRRTFDEFIFPYSKKLSKYYKGLNYYHSCGNLTPFLDRFKDLDIDNIFHVSQSTDLRKALEHIPQKVLLQCSLDPVVDVMTADEYRMRQKILSIMDLAGSRNVLICADALYAGGLDTIGKVKKLVNIFREVKGTD